MTSSLVGSEMCIRDSRRTYLENKLKKRGLLAPNFGKESLPEPQERALPVSYTHLTLPTICSV
eukprot:1134352-Prorocentrum_lima.AAC.1